MARIGTDTAYRLSEQYLKISSFKLQNAADMANCSLQYLTFTSLDISYAVQQLNLLSGSLNDTILFRSSVEAEYRGVANDVAKMSGLYADIFTNGLPSALFEEFRTSLSVRSSSAQTMREY
ncbi:hypothetical protein Tco_0531984 [Tanacetum coccineum]